ncbi:uncharacterized protein LOC133176061 [Saccostrea echinata]|uniref:uncharacterized protein LOC133176061 n=1 Tax=Saccostrea echinata TaxID=191078 RepID=UPI002A7EE374|nr:uncharacterized protein LOC133176061 [Saccostrea echinata]
MTSLVIGDSHVNRLRLYIGPGSSAADSYSIRELTTVKYYGISGGLVTNNHHLRKFSSIVQQINPHHLIVLLGGNDLDSPSPVELIVTKLVSFLTQLKHLYQLKTVTILSYFPRERTRLVSAELYTRRVNQANENLRINCFEHKLTYWKLRGFTNSRDPILRDGVHLNNLGNYKLVRQIRGVFLHQLTSTGPNTTQS